MVPHLGDERKEDCDREGSSEQVSEATKAHEEKFGCDELSGTIIVVCLLVSQLVILKVEAQISVENIYVILTQVNS